MAVTGERLYGLFAKDIPFDNANTIKKYGKSIKNYDSFLPQKLDIAVFPGKYGGGAGHVAMVTRATLTQFEVLEQNWLGQGWTNGVVSPGWGPEKVTRRWHYYDDPMYFIRLDFPTKISAGTKAKQIIKNRQASKKTKSKKL